MYKPAPARPRKTNIVRTRTGCKSCRTRRTKCDEQKPSCSTCSRLGKLCEQFSPKLEFRHVSLSPTAIGARKQDKKHSTRSRIDAVRLSSHDGSYFQRRHLPHSRISDNYDPRLSSGFVVDPVNPDSPTDQVLLESGGVPQMSTASPDFIAIREDLEVLGGWAFLEVGSPSDPGWDLSCDEPPVGILGDTPRAWEMMEKTLALSNSTLYSEDPDVGSDGKLRLQTSATISPARDPANIFRFYTDVWRQQCLPALHLVFDQLEMLRGPQPLPADIIVALSACRMSRMMPQRKIYSSSNSPGLCFRPDAGHESISHEYYGAVMRKMAWWSHQDFDANPALGLAVLVLFCYLESSMGNFQEFRLHSEGTKKLIRSYPHCVLQHGQGTELLAAWVEVEMQNWWRRVYFSTPDFHRKHGILSLNPQLELVLNTGYHQRAAVLLILCESHRLNSAAIASCWSDSGRREGLEPTDIEEGLPLNDFTALLKSQSGKLDAWYSCLQASDLPALWPGTQDNHDHRKPLELDIQPLSFKSHTSAMNFAYYVASKVMQCTGPLECLQAEPRADLGQGYGEAESWIMILLRVAAGLDWEQCIRFNVYTIGLSGLFLACVLRSRDLAVGLWMQAWLEERLRTDHEFEEGNFPVFQILEALRLVNGERRGGRDVLSLFQAVDDGGGSGKLGSYHSQRLASLLVYGRCRATGELYSYRRTTTEELSRTV